MGQSISGGERSMRERDKQMKMAGCPVTAEGRLSFCMLAYRLNLDRLQNASMKISQADSMKYLKLCDKYFIGWLRKYKPPAGRKTRLRVCTFVGVADRSAFAFTFDKSNKTYSASDFACRLVFGWNMIRCGQIFM